MYLELDRLSKQFDGKYAVHDLSLGLEEGGLLCICLLYTSDAADDASSV